MKQTKLESILEVFMNYLTGFVAAYLVYKFVVIPNPPLSESAFYTTSIFTAVSILRTYLWRRFFNAGIHKLIASFFDEKLIN